MLKKEKKRSSAFIENHPYVHGLPELIISLFFFAVLSLPHYASADPPGRSEYEVKAAFLYNFLKFVEWPVEKSTASPSAINLCILGHDPFGNSIDDFIAQKIAGKKISLQHMSSISRIGDCHAVFISGSEKGSVKSIADLAMKRHILTIGDTEEFSQQGVIINMFLENNKVRFEINPDAAKRAGLRIDARLLKLAVIARGRE